MAQTRQGGDLAHSPLVSRARHLLVLALASRSRRGRLFAFEFDIDFEDEGEDAPQVETPILSYTPER